MNWIIGLYQSGDELNRRMGVLVDLLRVTELKIIHWKRCLWRHRNDTIENTAFYFKDSEILDITILDTVVMDNNRWRLKEELSSVESLLPFLFILREI